MLMRHRDRTTSSMASRGHAGGGAARERGWAPLSPYTCSCPREATRRRRVRDGPAEVNLDLDNLLPLQREDLCVAESAAVDVRALIGHEHLVLMRHDVDKPEVVDLLTVWPAPLEIGPSIDPVVERAGGVKIIGDQEFDCRAVLAHVGLVAGSSYGCCVVHLRSSKGSKASLFIRLARVRVLWHLTFDMCCRGQAARADAETPARARRERQAGAGAACCRRFARCSGCAAPGVVAKGCRKWRAISS